MTVTHTHTDTHTHTLTTLARVENSALLVVASERLSVLDSTHVLLIWAGSFSWRGVKEVWA